MAATPANRDETGKFKKGCSGNPKGRPKVPDEFRQLAKSNSITALKIVIDIMNNPDAPLKDRLRAAEIVMDRAWGKAVQGLEMSGPDGAPLGVVILPEVKIPNGES